MCLSTYIETLQIFQVEIYIYMKYAKLLEEYVLVDLLNGVPFEADVKLEL